MTSWDDKLRWQVVFQSTRYRLGELRKHWCPLWSRGSWQGIIITIIFHNFSWWFDYFLVERFAGGAFQHPNFKLQLWTSRPVFSSLFYIIFHHFILVWFLCYWWDRMVTSNFDEFPEEGEVFHIWYEIWDVIWNEICDVILISSRCEMRYEM